MLLGLLNVMLLAGCSAASLHAQAQLHGSDAMPTRLSAVGGGNYTVLSYPVFPKHSVRISRVEGFCDTTVRVFTGYVDVEAKHSFFWFFESRRDPDTDDVMMWTNGGPGGSTATGMLMELGPCNIAGPNATTFNPYSWSSHVNMIFLDTPIGTGFSYADHGETLSRTEDAAVDVAIFFAILSESFPQFKGRRLHLAGESYAGRLLPVYGAAIVDYNRYIESQGLHPINLASVMIGNGKSDVYSYYAFQHDIRCTSASGLRPMHSISTCVRMKQATKRCLDRIQAWCYYVRDGMNCDAAREFCDTELIGPLAVSGLNPYDLSKPCSGIEMDVCYPEAPDVSTFLNSVEIRKVIRTDAHPANFSSLATSVFDRFEVSGDKRESSTEHLAGLLERGVRVLIYSGMYDGACSWLDNENMTRIIEWTGRDAFGEQPLREWIVDGHNVGKTRSWGPLTFASLYGAGHLAPHDKPVEALEMMKRWVSEESL